VKGRKPIPTSLKLINLSHNVRKDPQGEPQPEGELCAPPEDLSERQKVLWRHAIEHAPRGLLRHLDAQILAIWVIAADMHHEAMLQVQKYGMVVKSPKQGVPVQSPYLPIINRQAEIMMRAASELGFSPTSRSRITLAGSGKKENRFSNNATAKRA